HRCRLRENGVISTGPRPLAGRVRANGGAIPGSPTRLGHAAILGREFSAWSVGRRDGPGVLRLSCAMIRYFGATPAARDSGRRSAGHAVRGETFPAPSRSGPAKLSG